MSEDLFAEIFEERAAICEHDGGLPKDQAEAIAAVQVEKHRHACEVKSVVNLYRAAFEAEADIGGDLSECKAQGKKAVDTFLSQVARHRGQAAADRLRTDALNALKEK